MKVSLNLIRYYNDMYKMSADPAPDGVDKLIERIGLQLGAVEEVVDLGKKYKEILIVKVVSCVKHPNADKLSVCLVDDNNTFKGVKRDKNGLIEIVCGAPNVKAGMKAIWIPPGGTVPSTFDKEPFVIEAREIRGVVSDGMLASAKELDLGDDHTGILEIEDDLSPGADFAKSYLLDDHIIDIENKMFTHRPDCFGHLGVAREIAGIQGHKFKSPQWYREDAEVQKSRSQDDHKISFSNGVPKLVPRFTAAVIKDVNSKLSPVWLRCILSSLGLKPISNIVDLTNYYMILTAQPLHAYDYDKVLALQNNRKDGVKMGVRKSKKGEQLKLLGGKIVKLDEGAIIITADDKPIGLGGVMGGADTEVDEKTKHIILECANFEMNQTRKTAMRYGLFTDAATRFTKGQSPRQNMAILAKASEDITKIAGGRVSSVIDDNHFKSSANRVSVTADFINSRLGEKLSESSITKLLENVEFSVSARAGNLAVSAPFWRTDIEIPEDIVEEVGRLYGYEHLPQELPTRSLSPAPLNPSVETKNKIRDILSAAGANEILTYSFVHGKLLESAGQDSKLAYKINNAISPDLQYYRLSLTPSILDKVHPNIKAGFDIFALFELGLAHIKGHAENDVPKEFERLALVLAADRKAGNLAGAPYFYAKRYLTELLNKLNIYEVSFEPLDATSADPAVTYYESQRSATVIVGKTILGRIGEYNDLAKSGFKLPDFCAGFELGLEPLMRLSNAEVNYEPLNRFPTLHQDITLKLPANVSYGTATDFIYRFLDNASAKHNYRGSVSPIDIYRKKDDDKHQQITWRISLSHPDRTLTTQEVNSLLDELAEKAKQDMNAERT